MLSYNLETGFPGKIIVYSGVPVSKTIIGSTAFRYRLQFVRGISGVL